jgi:hypothetical protein
VGEEGFSKAVAMGCRLLILMESEWMQCISLAGRGEPCSVRIDMRKDTTWTDWILLTTFRLSRAVVLLARWSRLDVVVGGQLRTL